MMDNIVAQRVPVLFVEKVNDPVILTSITDQPKAILL